MNKERTIIYNYLKVAVRNIRRHKAYSFINIAGLSLGLACFMMITAFTRYNGSFDDFHQYKDRIYRVVKRQKTKDIEFGSAPTGMPCASLLKREFPQIEETVRIGQIGEPLVKLMGMTDKNTTLSYKDERFEIDYVLASEPSIFSVFSFGLLQGDEKNALREPNTVVLSPEWAKKLFGEEEALGQTLLLDDKYPLKVSGILNAPPKNSHLNIEVMVSLGTMAPFFGNADFPTNWDAKIWTYLLLRNGVDPADFEKQLGRVTEQYIPKGEYRDVRYKLQWLRDIRLNSDYEHEVGLGLRGRILRNILRMLNILGLVVLVAACLNTVNMSTLMALSRAKEVGVRKTIGAQRFQLAGQFLFESVISGLVALGAAFIVVEMLLPMVGRMVGQMIPSGYTFNPGLLAIMLVVTVIAGVISGAYPAFYLSRLQAAAMARTDHNGGAKASWFRRVLIIVQFIIAIAFFIITASIVRHIYLIVHQDLGFDPQNILVLGDTRMAFRKKIPLLKEELLRRPGITGVSMVSRPPLLDCNSIRFTTGDSCVDNEIDILYVDPDYFRVLGLKTIQGRDLAELDDEELKKAYIINRSALRKQDLHLEMGKSVYCYRMENGKKVWMHQGKVIGVVDDYAYRIPGENMKIQPLLLHVQSFRFNFMIIRFRPEMRAEIQSLVGGICRELQPDVTYLDYFLEDFGARNFIYSMMTRMAKAFIFFSVLSVLIAVSGLVALSSFTIRQRTKEIATRKVFGASVPEMILILSRRYIIYAAISFIVACPLAGAIMAWMVRSGALRERPSAFIYALAGGTVCLTALSAVILRAWKAALANPVDALRYE